MNVKFALSALAACSTLALAGEAPVENYVYGMPLDIAKVVSIVEPPETCGVVSAQMIYEDSQGAEHVLEYSKWSISCGSQEGGL